MKAADDSAAEPVISRKLLLGLGLCALALATYLASMFLGGPERPDSMAGRALTAADLGERERAAVELATVVDRRIATPFLRRVANETKDPQVLATVLNRLLFFRDQDSLPLCFAALTHSSKEVRGKVYWALQAYYGGSLPNGIEYSADAPADGLEQVAAKLNEIYTKRISGPGPGSRPVATAKKEEPGTTTAAIPKKQEPGMEPAAANKKDDAPPAPSASIALSQAPPPSYMAPRENPAVNLLAWTFRILAVLVLLVGLGGLFGLIGGERLVKKTKALNKQPPSLAEEVAKILAENPPGHSNKIAIFVASTICAVALLMAAELSTMAAELSRLAVRVEQKIDSLPQGR